MYRGGTDDRSTGWWDVAFLILDGADLFVWLIPAACRMLLWILGWIAAALII